MRLLLRRYVDSLRFRNIAVHARGESIEEDHYSSTLTPVALHRHTSFNATI